MIKLLFRSISLDFKFLRIPLPLVTKLTFIIKKYYLFLRNILSDFEPGKSHIKVFKKKYYYDDKYGTGFLQSVYVDHCFLSNFIKKKAIIVDIGANVGQFKIFCKHFLKAERVYSFEPIKKTFKLLKLNAPENNYNYAISTKKSLTLYVPELSLMASTHQKGRKEKVQAITLDDFRPLKRYEHIDLLKIDTEGSEHDVILASKSIIRKCRYLLVEASVSRASDGDINAITKTLSKICPKLKIVETGRRYKDNGLTTAIDILYETLQHK